MEESLAGMDSSWCKEEMNGVNLGDSRLDERSLKLIEQLSAKPLGSIGEACGDWASTKAAYRFFSNEKFSMHDVLVPHIKRTAERCNNYDQILLIQDTTSFNFGAREYIEGLGLAASGSKTAYGYYMHTGLAVTCEGKPLGVMSQINWSRKRKDGKKVKVHPFETSEGERWCWSVAQAKAQINEQIKVITVGDREIGKGEFFGKSEKDDFLYNVRVTKNRTGEIAGERGKITELLIKSGVKASYQLELKQSRGNQSYARSERTKRTAEIELFFSKAAIHDYKENKMINCFAIYAKEKNLLVKEDSVDWLLLTNVDVMTVTDALERVNWYKVRWEIELFHKILKSGCQVEVLRLETMERLEKYIAMMSIVSWRILLISYVNKISPDEKCDQILAEHEWKSLYCKIKKTSTPPDELPTVRQAVRWIAQLGGFLGRKRDGEPGITTIWRGWTRLIDISETWLLFNQGAICG